MLMTASQFRRSLISMCPGLDRRKTCDRIVAGNGKNAVRRVLVTWIADLDALRFAAENGFDTVVTHEATFYYHEKELMDIGRTVDEVMHGAVEEKLDIIRKASLTVIRCHDVWDRNPEMGPAVSLARYIGLGHFPAASANMQFRFDSSPMKAVDLALNIAEKLKPLGQDGIELFGDGEKTVCRVGICTGQAGSIPNFVRLGCDCAVISDDGSNYWKNIVWAQEHSFPVFRISHFTAEEPSMSSLTDYINRTFAPEGITAEHFVHRRRCRVVKSGN